MCKFFNVFLFVVLVFTIVAITIHCEGFFEQFAVMTAGSVVPAVMACCMCKKYFRILQLANIILLPVTFLIVLVVVCWEPCGKYDAPELQRPQAFNMGKVLVLVPHQDDEINCLGGVMGEINKAGKLYVLFSTNGGNYVRYDEAVRGAEMYGIPPEQVLCLGYGQSLKEDVGKKFRWGEPYMHMYNMFPDEVAVDTAGMKSIWNWKGIEGMIPGRLHTRDNFKADLKRVIEIIKPDTIICIDYDVHPDHRALSLLFEEVICELMKENPDYTPFILKSFAYSTSWIADPDFYADNLLSTKKTWSEPYMLETNCYDWADRLRLPVSNASLTRVLPGNIVRESFMECVSQLRSSPGKEYTIVNGDRVFWWRPTGNLLLTAQVKANGVNADHLTDVKLYDSYNVGDFSVKPLEHGWRPLYGNGEIQIKLSRPSKIEEIRLYDHVDVNNQIKRLSITLSNGKVINVDNLPANGAAKVVKTECSEILTGFDIKIERMTGIQPGLAEVEAYASSPVPPVKVVKLRDSNDDFMYDYTVPAHGAVEFSLYTWPAESHPEYKVSLVTDEGASQLSPDKQGLYRAQLENNDEAHLEVADPQGRIVDRVRIQNPPAYIRKWREIQRDMDDIMKHYSLSSQFWYYRKLYGDYKAVRDLLRASKQN